MADSLGLTTARALVPDQLLPYVRAVSGLKSLPCGQCVLHQWEGDAVLVAYPLGDPLNEAAMNEAVDIARQKREIKKLIVLSAHVPAAAAEENVRQRDRYWRLPLPAPDKGVKLRNILKRAARDVAIDMRSGENAWTEDHAQLASDFLERKKLDRDTAFLFGRMREYLAGAPDALLFSARRSDSTLAACAIGDFSALSTAFYMFAFRDVSAPPGSADLLLSSIMDEGVNRGHAYLNLGLGIDPGVEFFKKKWRAEPWLPYVETSLSPAKRRSSWFRRIFGQ